jgi:hypothetical protein
MKNVELGAQGRKPESLINSGAMPESIAADAAKQHEEFPVAQNTGDQVVKPAQKRLYHTMMGYPTDDPTQAFDYISPRHGRDRGPSEESYRGSRDDDDDQPQGPDSGYLD